MSEEFIITFPDLTDALVSDLERRGNGLLARKLAASRIRKVTFNPQEQTGFIELEPQERLGRCEENGVLVGGRHSVAVRQGLLDLVLEVDNFGGPLGVAIETPPGPLAAQMLGLAVP